MIARLKFIMQYTILTTFGILVGVSVQGIILHDRAEFQWYHPLSFIITGFLCSVVSLIMVTDRELPMKKYALRIGLHCILLLGMVMGAGYFFGWYDTFRGAMFVLVEYFCVYLFVWIMTAWMGALNQRHINKALDQIRDEE